MSIDSAVSICVPVGALTGSSSVSPTTLLEFFDLLSIEGFSSDVTARFFAFGAAGDALATLSVETCSVLSQITGADVDNRVASSFFTETRGLAVRLGVSCFVGGIPSLPSSSSSLSRISITSPCSFAEAIV